MIAIRPTTHDSILCHRRLAERRRKEEAERRKSSGVGAGGAFSKMEMCKVAIDLVLNTCRNCPLAGGCKWVCFRKHMKENEK